MFAALGQCGTSEHVDEGIRETGEVSFIEYR